jgi:hypothetical protein
MPPEQKDFWHDWKRNFNIGFTIFLAHQRALTVPLRSRYGKEALGIPCVLALVLMFLWVMATHDPFMWLWIGFWCLCFGIRRLQSVWLAAQGADLHSQYDGWPHETVRFVGSERLAKLVVEPLLFGGLGYGLWWLYDLYGLPPHGLPYFFLLGLASLPFVEAVKGKVWERRVQAMRDARLEQDMVMDAYRQKYGDS